MHARQVRLDAAATGRTRSAATRWLNVAEWIVLGLGGEARPEASLASRTGFYDLHTGRAWAPAMRGRTRRRARAAARPARARRTWADAPASGTPHGHEADACAREARGAVLAVGGHDHAAAAVGAGAAGEGDVLDSCGTAEAILRATAPLDPATVAPRGRDGFTVGRHALPGRYVLQGAFWSGEQLQAVIDGYGDALDGVPAGARGGRRGGADILARMEALAGPCRRLVVTGGWSDRPEVREVKRRHLGPFEHVAEGFAGCRGAATGRSFPGFMIPAGSQRSLTARSSSSPSAPISSPR